MQLPPNMLDPPKKLQTVAELIAESERIRARAAIIMAEIKAILREMAERKARESSSADESRMRGEEVSSTLSGSEIGCE